MTESGNPVGQVADCLLNIEMELRQLGLWESEPPPDEAFQSAQPFCIDTLEFTQWLQFVFVERMKIIIEPSSAVPVGAVLNQKNGLTGKKVGVILTGGNVDLEKLRWS